MITTALLVAMGIQAGLFILVTTGAVKPTFGARRWFKLASEVN